MIEEINKFFSVFYKRKILINSKTHLTIIFSLTKVKNAIIHHMKGGVSLYTSRPPLDYLDHQGH